MDRSLRYSLVIGGLAVLFFMPFLGAVHLFDWDEVNFAECSREMIVLQDYLRVHIDFKPFWEKTALLFSGASRWPCTCSGWASTQLGFPNAVLRSRYPDLSL